MLKKNTDLIERYLQIQQKNFKLPALSVGIISRELAPNSQAYHLPINHNEEERIYKIGSLTKLITALGILLQEDISDNDLAVTYLPWLSYYGATTIRIKDLISHSAGLTRGNYFRRNPSEDEIKTFFLKEIALNPPTEMYKYSNLGYMLLGLILEKVSGKSFSTVIKEKVFHPLEMQASGFGMDRAINDKIICGHALKCVTRVDDSPFVPIEIPLQDATTAAFGMHSSIKDYLRLVNVLLTGGKYKGREVFPKKIIDRFFDANTSTKINNSLRYGMGVIWQKRFGRSSFFHTGSHWGHSAAITVFPKDGLAIVAMANRAGAGVELNTILRSISKFKFSENKASVVKTINPYRRSILGKYVNARHLIQISKVANRLVMQIDEEAMVPLIYRGHATFIQKGGKWSNEILRLRLREKSVEGIVIGTQVFFRNFQDRQQDDREKAPFAYEGIYRNSSLGNVTVYNRSDQIILTISATKEVSLEQVKKYHFRQLNGPFVGEELEIIPEKHQLRIGTMIFSKVGLIDK